LAISLSVKDHAQSRSANPVSAYYPVARQDWGVLAPGTTGTAFSAGANLTNVGSGGSLATSTGAFKITFNQAFRLIKWVNPSAAVKQNVAVDVRDLAFVAHASHSTTSWCAATANSSPLQDVGIRPNLAVTQRCGPRARSRRRSLRCFGQRKEWRLGPDHAHCGRQALPLEVTRDGPRPARVRRLAAGCVRPGPR
jgi:hypothetical protein